jgi:hypothetical protein
MTTGRATIAGLISLAIMLVIVTILIMVAGVALFALFGIASSSGPIPGVTVSP